MIEYLMGVFTAMIVVAITQYLQYFFTTRTEKNKIKTENTQRMKGILIELAFYLTEIGESLTSNDSLKNITNDYYNKKYMEIIKKSIETSSTLCTFPSTKNLARAIENLTDDAASTLRLLFKKTKGGTKILEPKDVQDINKKIDKIINTTEKLLSMSA